MGGGSSIEESGVRYPPFYLGRLLSRAAKTTPKCVGESPNVDGSQGRAHRAAGLLVDEVASGRPPQQPKIVRTALIDANSRASVPPNVSNVSARPTYARRGEV